MSSRPIIYPLTALRFFFALAVFGHHCYFLSKEGDGWGRQFYNSVLSEGYIGVSFFFVLSGFILAYNYQERLLSKSVSWRGFYRARIARIYPLHIITLLIVLPITSGGLSALVTGEGAATFLAHLTLTQSYWFITPVYTAYNSPSWSISTELFFYLAFPVLTIGVAKLVRRYGRHAFWVFGLALIVPLAIPLVPADWRHAVFYVHPLARIADFFLGILLFNVFSIIPVSALPAKNSFTLLEVGSIGLLALFVGSSGGVPGVYRYSVYYWVPMILLIGVFAYQRGMLSGWLRHPVWQLLGEISFAFYMVHRPVMWYYKGIKEKLFPFNHLYVDVAAMLILTLMASYVLYRYFERPVGRWVRGARSTTANSAGRK